jgi:aspartate/methionine/tyrosine aminotransferase
VHIEPFLVEQWMNSHETTARWNIAETCVHSLTVDELLALTGDDGSMLARLTGTRLTYGHITGSPELRAAVATLYGGRIGPDEVLITNGAIGANFLALFALTEPGSSVVCVKPTYQQLLSVPEALGADVRPLLLRPENAYLPDVEELRSLVDGSTRLIVLNNPNNPTGSLMGEQALRAVVDVARELGAWVVCDEVYRMLEHVPGTTAPSIADLYEKGVSTGSLSKSYSLAGLRMGWLAGPPEAIARCLDLRDYTTISCGMLDDMLSTVTLEHRDAILERNLEIVRGNLAILDEWAESEKRLSYVHPHAGTTVLVRYDYPLPSVDLCQGLFDFNGAFVVPGAAFGEESSFRLGYACARDVLTGGLDAISAYLRTLES